MVALALFISFAFACSYLAEGFTTPSSSTHRHRPQPRATLTVFTKESVWDAQFSALHRYKDKHGDCLVPISYSDDPELGIWVHQQRANAKAGRVTDDRLKRLHSIGVFWDEQFAALQRYKNEHGDCLVPRRYSDDPQLAQWVTKQRQDAKAGEVSGDRMKRLESIGFVFAPQHRSWDEQFAALQRYKKEHGNCLVPNKYSDDPKLGRWVHNQRRDAKLGEMTDNRIARLQSIGFIFNLLEYIWDEQFAALQRYKNEHGHCLVPAKYSEDPQLGNWVIKQRANAKAGTLTDDRLKRLECIGFLFDVQDYIWDEQFAALQRYKNEHGNCLVPQSYSDDPQLGSWVNWQRSNASAGKLTDDRIKRLESIGFIFDVHAYLWDERFAALQRYTSEHGNCLVPRRFRCSDNPKLKLGYWVEIQRSFARAGKMNDDRLKRLESIGFEYDGLRVAQT